MPECNALGNRLHNCTKRFCENVAKQQEKRNNFWCNFATYFPVCNVRWCQRKFTFDRTLNKSNPYFHSTFVHLSDSLGKHVYYREIPRISLSLILRLIHDARFTESRSHRSLRSTENRSIKAYGVLSRSCDRKRTGKTFNKYPAALLFGENPLIDFQKRLPIC